MILNLKTDEVKAWQTQTFDVCIIGAGAAGITLATQLAQAGKTVALCEGGEEDYAEDSQNLYKGKVVGDPYFELDIARLRYLGGTTNHWAGMSRSFEPVDFQRQKQFGDSFEWPIAYSELKKYQPQACGILEIPDNYDQTDQALSKEIKRITFNWSPPVRFKSKYYEEIKASKLIHLLIGANLVNIDGGNRRIDKIHLTSTNGKRAQLAAKRFIFAMGGIENSRFMLHFANLYGSKFFDAQAPIGKYWMEHPHFTLGEAIVNREVSDHIYYALTQDAQIAKHVMGCGFRIEKQTKEGMKKLINDLMCVVPGLGKKVMGMAKKELVCGVTFRAAWEQAPHIDNKVALSKDVDALGIPRVNLHWKKSELDRRTVTESVALYNDWLLKNDLGRIRLDEWLLTNQPYPTKDELAGYHHMGGTRMAKAAKWGVVDSQCKVFGSDNLYIAGSSVFTTGGHNNPTLPLVTLALRLKDHLLAAA